MLVPRVEQRLRFLVKLLDGKVTLSQHRHLLEGIVRFLLLHFRMFDDRRDRFFDAALERHRVCAGGYVFQTFSNDSLRQNSSSSSTITCNICSFRSNFFNHLSTHVLNGIFQRTYQVKCSFRVFIYFTIHDPTTLNRQGADVGTQYRSVIFYHDDEQRRVAEQVISDLESEGIWSDPIVTEVAAFDEFYVAEDYHQNYFRNNGFQPYCQVIIAPKVAKFRKEHLDRLKA